MLHEEIITM